MNLIDFSTSAWSLIPSLVALALAIITRRVILSLSVGIIIGGFMLNNSDILSSVLYIKDNFISLFYSKGELNTDSVYILLFLVLLGGLTELLNVSGSNQAFANWIKTKIKTRRGAKLMTSSLVFFTFIDDYFHTLAVGAISRPITDKFKISRAKLAYILDSTAAPMCVLMPVSSWGAYIITLVAGLLAAHSITTFSPMEAFLTMSSMNFYAIFSVIMVFVVSYFSLDFGSMDRLEKIAMQQETKQEEPQMQQGKIINLVLPIAMLLLGTVAMMMYTGHQGLSEQGKSFSILGAFENTTVGISLVVGGLSSVIAATMCILFNHTFDTKVYLKAWKNGAKSMFGAMLILCFAWTINGIVGDMQTGKYLSTLVEGRIDTAFLPAILFLLSVFMAFSTGTSWGTFGMMLPIGAAIAANAEPSLILPCLSAVLAGAVCGDHCSPISDTTILSSTGAECNLMDHVTSQLPYSLLVAVATTLGYIALGFTHSLLIGFAITTVVFIGLVLILKRKISN